MCRRLALGALLAGFAAVASIASTATAVAPTARAFACLGAARRTRRAGYPLGHNRRFAFGPYFLCCARLAWLPGRTRWPIAFALAVAAVVAR
jgi:hypothetical protein